MFPPSMKDKEELLKENDELMKKAQKHQRLPKFMYRACMIVAIWDLAVVILCILARAHIAYSIINGFFFLLMLWLARDHYNAVQAFQTIIDGCVNRRHNIETTL